MSYTQPITDTRQLSEFCRNLRTASSIAIDTEFTRVRTYYSKLQLIQIASEELEFCIDVPQHDDLSPLQELLSSFDGDFIFHDASQDLDALRNISMSPGKIFDTQIAATFCGLKEISYRRVVEQCLGVSLSKSSTKTNWDRRPLSRQQIEYAMNDVRYLFPVHNKLLRMLQKLGYSDWVEEECTDLLNIYKLKHRPEPCWKQFKFGAELQAADQIVAKDLVIWRDRRAKRVDMPLQWVLRDQQIFDIAALRPKTPAQLKSKIGVGRNLSNSPPWMTEILAIANRHRNKTSKVVWKKNTPLSAEKKRICNEILQIAHDVADRLNLPTTVLCTRKEATRLARNDRRVRLRSGWRYDQVGKEVFEYLNHRQVSSHLT